MNRREWLACMGRAGVFAAIGLIIGRSLMRPHHETVPEQALARCEQCRARASCALPEAAAARRFFGIRKAPNRIPETGLCGQEPS